MWKVLYVNRGTLKRVQKRTRCQWSCWDAGLTWMEAGWGITQTADFCFLDQLKLMEGSVTETVEERVTVH